MRDRHQGSSIAGSEQTTAQDSVFGVGQELGWVEKPQPPLTSCKMSVGLTSATGFVRDFAGSSSESESTSSRRFCASSSIALRGERPRGGLELAPRHRPATCLRRLLELSSSAMGSAFSGAFYEVMFKQHLKVDSTETCSLSRAQKLSR